MGAYTSIRGWLEVHDKSLKMLHDVLTQYESRAEEFGLTRDGAEFYNRGWVIPEECINWTHYVFYGADVKTHYVDFIRAEMEAIAKLYFVDSEIDQDWGFHPVGIIHIEEDGTHEYPPDVWKIGDGVLSSEQIKREPQR